MNRVLFLLLILLTTPSTAIGQVPIATAKSEVSIGSYDDDLGQGWVRVTTNRTFRFADFAGSSILIHEQSEVTEREAREYRHSTITAEAFGGPAYEESLWRIEDPGEKGAILWEEFYIATTYGCCGADDSHAIYSLRYGTKLLRYDSNLITLPGLNVVNRLIGYQSINAPIILSHHRDDNTVFGLLTYASSEGPIDRVLFHSVRIDELELWWAPEISVVQENDDQSKAPLIHFEIKLTFTHGQELLVPVREDRIDLAAAVVPDGINLAVIYDE